MENTNTTIRTQDISKINLNALSSINNLIENRIFQDGKYTEKLNITVGFDGYADLMEEIKSLLDIIIKMILDSSIQDVKTLNSIASISKLIVKMIPIEDMGFLDELLFASGDPNLQNFQTLDKINLK